MPRPENPIDPTSGPIAAFAYALRDMRTKAGNPPYKAMAKRVHYSVGALSQAAAGARLPTWEVTQAYVRACGGHEGEWRQRWEHADATVVHKPRSPVHPGGAVTQRNEAVAAWPADRHNSSRPDAQHVLPPGKPEPRQASSPPELLAMLNQLRTYAGLSLRDLAIRSKSEPSISKHPVILARSTLSPVLRGDGRALRFEEVLRIVEICGDDPKDLGDWSTAWSRLFPYRDQTFPATHDAVARSDVLTAARERFQDLRAAQEAARSARHQADRAKLGKRQLIWVVCALTILILMVSGVIGLVIL